MTRLRNIPLALRLQGMVALLVVGFLATIVDALHIEKNRALDARATELHALVQVANGIAHSLHAAGHVLGAASDLSAQSQGLSEQLVRLVGEVRAA